MPICHGQGDQAANAAHGDPFDGGCCHLPGDIVCPSRWYIDYTGAATTRDARIIDHTRTDIGSVDEYVKQVHNGKPRQDRVVEMIEGSIYVCGALANSVIAAGIPTGANWEADFDAAWSAEYEAGGSAETVGDAWAAANKPRNWCVIYGPGEGDCCFREDQATNDARAANLTTTRVAIASRSTLGG